ncbi:MAG: copper resistance protein CopD, partial [Ignavibacteriales bacterium]
MYKYIILLHILGATIWTGGHLILAILILPKALKNRSVETIKNFEEPYEKIGIPALVVQVLTGFYLAYNMLPDVSYWFSFHPGIPTLVGYKIILLLLTLLLAADARFRVIPHLNENNLSALAWHIIPVT